MRSPLTASRLSPMAHHECMRLTLELDSRAEPITGRIGDESGQTRNFAGWLGLAAALGSVLGSGQPAKEAGAEQPPTSTEPAQSNG
jgi:hypothetical protein